MAFIYNAIAHAVGGIEVELQTPAPVIFNTPQVPLPSAGPIGEVAGSQLDQADATPSS
jgi:hypothetical protein